MTPIIRGTATKLGLRKPRVLQVAALRRAERWIVCSKVVADQSSPMPRVVNLYQWRAFENGIPVGVADD